MIFYFQLKKYINCTLLGVWNSNLKGVLPTLPWAKCRCLLVICSLFLTAHRTRAFLSLTPESIHCTQQRYTFYTFWSSKWKPLGCTHTLPRVKVRFLSVIFSLLVRQRFPFDFEMCTLYTIVYQIYIARDPINPMAWFRRALACMGYDICCTTSQFFISTLYTFLTTLHSTPGRNPWDFLF